MIHIFSFPSHANERFACEVKKREVLDQVLDSNFCRDESDCSYVNIMDCNEGCATLPIYKHMEQRIDLAVRDYNASCANSCKANCKRYLQSKCIRNKCEPDFRDWKYLTKEK